MASLDFYATREDLIDLLAHVFDLGIFRLFETYSRYDSELYGSRIASVAEKR